MKASGSKSIDKTWSQGPREKERALKLAPIPPTLVLGASADSHLGQGGQIAVSQSFDSHTDLGRQKH